MRIMTVRLLRRKLYAWYNAYRKKENAKVRNYNLRDLDSEMKIKLFSWPFDIYRWLVEGEDEEVVHEVLVRHHRHLTSHRLLISRPLLRLEGVQLLLLHELVQQVAKKE